MNDTIPCTTYSNVTIVADRDITLNFSAMVDSMFWGVMRPMSAKADTGAYCPSILSCFKDDLTHASDLHTQ